MYQALTVLSTLAIITGAGYYLYNNDVVGVVKEKDSQSVVLAASGTPGLVSTDKPNELLADVFKGTYKAENGQRIMLRIDGGASFIAPDATYPGIWSIDDTGTITLQYSQDGEIMKMLFDPDQEHASLIEVSNSQRTVYVRQ